MSSSEKSYPLNHCGQSCLFPCGINPCGFNLCRITNIVINSYWSWVYFLLQASTFGHRNTTLIWCGPSFLPSPSSWLFWMPHRPWIKADTDPTGCKQVEKPMSANPSPSLTGIQLVCTVLLPKVELWVRVKMKVMQIAVCSSSCREYGLYLHN